MAGVPGRLGIIGEPNLSLLADVRYHDAVDLLENGAILETVRNPT